MSNRSLTEKDLEEVRYLYAHERYTKLRLSQIYNCSITTIALWLPKRSKYRTLKLKSNSKRDIMVCYKCGEDIKNHKRCPLCTILLHNNTCSCK